jgi:nucleotide sugar dehydrogenase
MRVCVVGLGKIGVPLAFQFASKGADVVGYDIDPQRCDEISAGRNPLSAEPGLDAIVGVAASGKLRASTDPRDAAAGADVVVFIVPVDVDAANRPDFSMLDPAVDAIGPHLKRGALVLVETTVPVGTTRHRVGGRIASASGMKPGADFTLAFSPERVSSGSVLLDLQRYPKIVGGIDDASTERAAAFYAQVLDADVLCVRDAETAEYSKLLETTYRDVNIALANELARAGDALGVDTRAAIAAANTQPYSHIHTPGPGVGGHCIPVYPYFIASPEAPSSSPIASDLVTQARRTNDAMATYAIDRLASAMGDLKGATIVILGLAYRANVKESRHSSAFGLVSALDARGATVYVHDSLYNEDEIRSLGLAPPPAWPLPCHAIVIQALHDEVAAIDYTAFTGLQAVLDPRGVLERASVEEKGIKYLGIGIPS